MKKFIRLLRANSLYLILGIMVFGFVRCDSSFNEREEHFDPREHPIIEKGDILVFNGSVHVDSFHVIESEFYLPHMRFGEEEDDYEQYRGVMNHGTYVDTSITLEIGIIHSFYTLFYYYPFSSYGDDVLTAGSIEKNNGGHSIKIGNISLGDLHKVDFTNSIDRPNMFIEIDSAYFSKTYGFVKYIKFTGEEFLLSEESLEMLMKRE